MKKFYQMFFSLVSVLILTLSSVTQAMTVNAKIDTSTYVGTNAELIFDFIAGDGTAINNVMISNFATDGTLGLQTNEGDGVSGDLQKTGRALLQNTQFFNEIRQSLVLGNYIHFNLSLTNNVSPGTTTPDALSIFLFDTFLNPLYTTVDPTGSNALVQFNINNSPGLDTTIFGSTSGGNSIMSVQQVPEPALFWLVGIGLFAMIRLRAYPLTFNL